MTARPLTLGTAGHVDHGKTQLVRALTGHDTDRLQEEKDRGLSIVLGYAPLTLPSGRQVSIVDVPGHHRFIRTMIAGATGIDLFLLCVAADDCVMPQTREHLTVLDALGVRSGVVAVTKVDRAPPGPCTAAVEALLPGAEIVPVCAPRGEGLARLRDALERAAATVVSRAQADRPVCLHVDRVFTLAGIGTVATGTLWSGRLEVGDRLLVLPQAKRVRVRSLQIHDSAVADAPAGQRVAVALSGIRRDEIKRGDVICSPDSDLRPTRQIRVSISPALDAPPLAHGAQVQVLHATRQALGRVNLLGQARLDAPGVAELRLQTELMPAVADRVVLRHIAPPLIAGGGGVIRVGPEQARPHVAPHAVVSAPDDALDDAQLRLAELLRGDDARPRPDAVLAAAAGLNPNDSAVAWRAIERAGLAVRTGPNLHFDHGRIDDLVARIVALCEREGRTTVAAVRDELGTSRRHAVALLAHLNSTRQLVREGDQYRLRGNRGA